MPVTQPAGAVRTLGTGLISDQVISQDGKTLYLAAGGTISAYDLASGAATGSWNLGANLGGIDVSPDGRYVVATDLQAGPVKGTFPGATIDYSVRVLDTKTGQVATYTSTIPAFDWDQATFPVSAPYYDARFIAGGKILLAAGPNSPYAAELTVLDPAAGTFTAEQDSAALNGILTTDADRTTVLIKSRYGGVELYEVGKGPLGQINFPYDARSQAISSDGSTIALGRAILDTKLDVVLNLFEKYSTFDVVGEAFSASGDAIYWLDEDSSTVFKLRTSDWTVLAGWSTGPLDYQIGNGDFSDDLTVSADGHWLSVLGASGARVIDLTRALSDTGTAGNDVLTGDNGANVLYGFAGDDVLEGVGNTPAEADTLYGGPGNDTYYINGLGDRVIEGYDADGYDTVYSSVRFQSTGGIEKIVLTGTADTGTGAQTIIGNDADNFLGGTELDDLLIGNGGNDQLSGFDGKDRLEGGKGNDSYIVDELGDQLIELAGEGTDTIYAGISYVLPDNFENLVLTGFNNKLPENVGTGNAADNVITGTARNDRLEGLAGNDLLVGDPYGWSTAGPDTLLGGDGNDTLLGAALDSGGRATDDIGSERDVISGEGGDDVVWAGAGDDADGGAGSDTLNLSLAAAKAGVTITTSAIIGAGTTTVAGGKLSGFEALARLRTTELADDITIDSAVTTVAAGAGNDVIKVTTTKGVTVDGGAGDDLFFGGAGNDSFEGSAGEDTAQFRGNRGDYKIVLNGPQITVTDLRSGTNDGTDTLTRVEILRFADGDVSAISLLNPPLPDDWRLFAPDLFQGQIGGSGTVFGTAGQQAIVVLDQPGTVAFDPSFNRGGDFIRLDGKAGEWSVVRSGSNALFTDGDTFVTVPFSNSATQMVFDDGYRALRVQSNGVPAIGAQFLGTTLTTIGAPPNFDLSQFLEPDPNAAARLFLAAGADVTAAEGRFAVFGSNGAERFVAQSGKFTLDPSFNRGGDTLVLDDKAGTFTAVRTGSSVSLHGLDTDITIPVGISPTTIRFDDGDRSVRFDQGLNAVLIGSQTIGFTETPLTFA